MWPAFCHSSLLPPRPAAAGRGGGRRHRGVTKERVPDSVVSFDRLQTQLAESIPLHATESVFQYTDSAYRIV